MDGDGDGDFVVFRPSTGTWYGADPDFSIAWGQPGDIPVPRSDLPGRSILGSHRVPPNDRPDLQLFQSRGFIVHGRDEHRGSIRLAWRRPPSGQMEVGESGER